MDLYINEEWYLCYNTIIFDDKIEENIVLKWKPIWFKQVKFKLNKDWLFEQVEEVKENLKN